MADEMLDQGAQTERPDTDEKQFSESDETLLKEIRERFDYATNEWKSAHDEAEKDMRYAAGDSWEPHERKKREDTGRPCLAFDEISQYTNQLINDVRQNKRAVKVDPRGNGANDQTARLRAGLIRDIEYKSNAQSAYICAFENAVNRSYGYWRINTKYVSEKSFDQEIVIRRIQNPDTILFDPDCQEFDCSDAMYCFATKEFLKTEFRKKFPEAQIQDFTALEIDTAGSLWIDSDHVQVAEYWRVHMERAKLLLTEDEHGIPIAYFDNDPRLKKMGKFKIIKERETYRRKVQQFITNGVEILERKKWAGQFIPIVPVMGKELWLRQEGRTKRVLMSMIRLARDPQQLYNYYRTCEAELVGMTPKTPWIGYEGQFDAQMEDWQLANVKPIAFLQVKAQVEDIELAPGQILPLPQRQSYTPEIEPLEMGAESSRRAIQSAMGISPLPTAAQRLTEKSGEALKEIDKAEDRGSFHFIDNFEMALAHSGRIINDLMDKVYDTEREITIRDEEDQPKTVPLHREFKEEDGTTRRHSFDIGEHQITISTGPSQESERTRADEFADKILENVEALPFDPSVKAKLLSYVIKLKNIGPIGDQMAELLAPNDDAAAAQQQAAQMQGQIQNLTEQTAILQQENQKMYMDKVGKIVENQAMLQKAAFDNFTKVLVAEIGTKSQDAVERERMFQEAQQYFLDKIHEMQMQAAEHAQEQFMQKQQAAAAQQQAATQAANQPQPAQAAG